MLFIDHHQAEPGKIHPLLDQRMGAYYQLRLAPGDQAPVLALAILLERPGQQNHFVAPLRPLQQLACSQEVLGSQDLRGRHEGSLVAVLDRHQHGLQGYDSLS